MLKAVLHALTSSDSNEISFLVVLVLPLWNDTPWNAASIRDHRNMGTLIRIPVGHMRFVPTRRQSDDLTASLPPAKWPMEGVLISSEAARENCLDQARIRRILSRAI
jgi:hypothetical protein